MISKDMHDKFKRWLDSKRVKVTTYVTGNKITMYLPYLKEYYD